MLLHYFAWVYGLAFLNKWCLPLPRFILFCFILFGCLILLAIFIRLMCLTLNDQMLLCYR